MTVRLDGDTSGLVNAVNQATTAFINFGKTTARIVKDTARFGPSGDIITRTLLQMDAAGNKVATTFARADEELARARGELTQTSVVVKAASANLKILASQTALVAEANDLLAQANTRATTATGKQDAALVADAAALKADAIAAMAASDAKELLARAQNNSGAAAATRLKGTKLEIEADRLSTLAINAATAARASAVIGVDAEVLALRARAAAIKASVADVTARGPAVETAQTQQGKDEERVAAEFRKISAQRIADNKRITAARVAAEKRVAAEFRTVSAQRIAVNKQIIAQRIADEKRVAAVFKGIQDQRLAFNKRVTEARVAAEKRVAAEFKKQQAKQLAFNKRITEARVAAEKRVAAAFKKQQADQLAFRKRVTEARVAAEKRVAAVFKKLQARRLAFLKRVTSRRIKDEERVAKAFRKQQAKQLADANKLHARNVKNAQQEFVARVRFAERYRAKLFSDIKREKAKRLQAIQQEFAARVRFAEQYKAKLLREIQLEKAARLKAINTERAARLSTRRGTTDFRTVAEGGTASKQAVQGFLTAEAAARKLVATGKVAGNVMDAALKRAQAGALKLAGDLSIAERAALKVATAENKVAAGARQAAVASKGMLTSFKQLGNLIGISLLIGGAFRLVTALTDAARAAGELSIKLAEIETLTNDNAFATEKWTQGLRNLSNQFGIDTLKQAEGAYQILSSQIKNTAGETLDASESLEFLGVANKLAVTGITDTATSTTLLTAALNSFKVPAEEAELAAAQLFKTVVLGRLTLPDLAQGFGRVGVPAKQLGLELSDLLGVQAQITNQGVKLNEANTLIRGILLKLIKPTTAMKEAFKALGVANAEALFAARGTIGAFAGLEKQFGGTTTEVAKAFSRVRAITGALSIFGENAKQTARFVGEIGSTTTKAFGKNTQKVLESTGQQFKQIAQTAKNLFEKEFGSPAIKALLDLIKEFGGIENIIRKTIGVMVAFGRTFRTILSAQIIGGALTGIANLATAFKAARTAAISFGVALAGLPLVAIATAAVLAGNLIAASINETARLELKAAEDANLAVLKRRKEAVQDAKNLLAEQTRATIKEFKATAQLQLQAISKSRKDITDQISETAEASKSIQRELGVATTVFTKNLTSRLTAVKKTVNDTTKSATGAAKEIEKTFQSLAKSSLEINLIGSGSSQQVAALQTAINQARELTEKAIAKGDFKAFQLADKRVRELTKQRIDAAITVSNASVRLEQDLASTRDSLRRSTSRAERQLLKQRINDIQRQQRLLKTGNKAQLDAETKIAKLQEGLGQANTGDQFDEIFKAITKVRKEQEAIEKSAKRERQIRLQGLASQAEQLRNLEIIKQKNEQRAQQAKARERRLEVAQFLFKAISKEADAFNQKQVFAIKDRDELLKRVKEQQDRLARIRSLQTLIGGGAEAEGLQRARALQLEAATNEQLQKRASDLQAKNLSVGQKDIEKQIKAIQSLGTTNTAALTVFNANLEKLDAAISQFQKVDTSGGVEVADSRLAQAEQSRIAFGGPSGELGTTRENQAITGAIDFSATRKNILVQEAIVRNIRENVQRLRELSVLLGQGEQPKAIITEFNSRFVELKKDLVAVGTRRAGQTGLQGSGSLLGSNRTADIEGIDAAVSQILTSQAGTIQLGDIPGAVAENQARQSSIESLKEQNRLIDVAIGSKAGEVIETDKSTQALLTFEQRVTAASEAIKKRQAAFANAPDLGVAPGPSVLPSADSLVREIGEGVARKATGDLAPGALKAGLLAGETFNEVMIAGAPEVAKKQAEASIRAEQEALQRGAASAGRAQAANKIAEENKARIRLAPGVEARLAKIRAQALASIPPETTVPDRKIPRTLVPKKIDTTIRLGRGASPIRAQQAAIRAQQEQEAKRQAAFRKSRDKALAEARRQSGVRPGARIPGTPRAGTFTGGPRPGTFGGGPRPGTFGGGSSIQQKQLTAEEQTAANTKVLADAARSASSPSFDPSALGLGVKAPTQKGTPESRVGPALLAQIGRGQAQAEVELDRFSRNRVLLAKKVELTDEKIRALQLQRADISFEDVAARKKALEEIKRQRDNRRQLSGPTMAMNDPGSSRDALTRSLTATRRDNRPLPGLSGLNVTRVGPTGMRPQGDDNSTNNVGPFTFNITESNTPQLTSKQVMADIQRAARTGTFKITRSN